MSSLRSALFLDFDSVFTGLLELDAKAALRFPEEPGMWLDRLGFRVGGPSVPQMLGGALLPNPEISSGSGWWRRVVN